VTAAAFCALRLERFDEAEALLTGVPIALPSSRLLHGRLLLERGRLEEVVEILTPALASAPEAMEIDVRKVMARALLELGRPAEAVELLERYGTGASTALLLSRALFENGDPKRALSVLGPLARQVAAESSRSGSADGGVAAAVGAQYGHVLHAMGASEAAVPFLQLAVRADPESRIAWHALGQALAAVGRRQEALDALAEARRLLEADP
jgi:predicted Zn-dependent protease